MTYNEAFVTVCRMLSTSSGSRFYADLYIAKYYYENNQEVCNPYYQFCIDTGMINCKKRIKRIRNEYISGTIRRKYNSI